jgi:hypothetical protein
MTEKRPADSQATTDRLSSLPASRSNASMTERETSGPTPTSDTHG